MGKTAEYRDKVYNKISKSWEHWQRMTYYNITSDYFIRSLFFSCRSDNIVPRQVHVFRQNLLNLKMFEVNALFSSHYILPTIIVLLWTMCKKFDIFYIVIRRFYNFDFLVLYYGKIRPPTKIKCSGIVP